MITELPGTVLYVERGEVDCEVVCPTGVIEVRVPLSDFPFVIRRGSPITFGVCNGQMVITRRTIDPGAQAKFRAEMDELIAQLLDGV